MIIKIISEFFNIFFSVPFFLMAFFLIVYNFFYNRFRKNFFRLLKSWGVGASISFIVYLLLYCIFPILFFGLFVYFSLPFLMGGSKIPACYSFIFISILKLSFFIGAATVLITVFPKIKKFNINNPSFFESIYILFFLKLYIDCAYSVIQPGIFLSEQYGRFHPPLYIYIIVVVFVFTAEQFIFVFFKNMIKPVKIVNRIKGIFVQLVPLVIISESIFVSFSEINQEPPVDRTDPANMPSFYVIIQSYFIQELLDRYTDKRMGHILADCILSDKDHTVTDRKYNRIIPASPINKKKY